MKSFIEFVTEGGEALIAQHILKQRKEKAEADRKQHKIDVEADSENHTYSLYIPDELNPSVLKKKTKYTNVIPDSSRGADLVLHFMWGTQANIMKELSKTFRLSTKDAKELFKRATNETTQGL